MPNSNSIFIDEEYLEQDFDVLRYAGLSWKNIGICLDISPRTLYNIRIRINYIDKVEYINNDDDLDEIVSDLCLDCPERGIFGSFVK